MTYLLVSGRTAAGPWCYTTTNVGPITWATFAETEKEEEGFVSNRGEITSTEAGV